MNSLPHSQVQTTPGLPLISTRVML